MPYNYTTFASIELAKGDLSAGDESLFTNLFIPAASRAIDEFTQRRIVAETETRYYDAVEDIDGYDLLLDEDCISVTTITNGDGSTISSSNYVLLPLNRTPKFAIRLKSSSSITWTYQTDPEAAISVAGSFGYSSGTPADIQFACQQLAIYMYERRDVPFLQVGLAEAGMPSVQATIPLDIQAILNPYRKVWFGTPK